METTFSIYEQTLYQLAIRLGLTYSNDEWQIMVNDKIKGTNVNRSMGVAIWVVDFFTCFIEQQEVDDISFDTPDRGLLPDDRWVSLASVLLPGEWKYEGEYRSVSFESIRFEGYIMYEGNFYSVNRY